MSGAYSSTALELAQRLRMRVNELNRAHVPGAQHSRVTVSIGIATQAANSTADKSSLIARADEAMYRAKHGGRDRIELGAMD